MKQQKRIARAKSFVIRSLDRFRQKETSAPIALEVYFFSPFKEIMIDRKPDIQIN